MGQGPKETFLKRRHTDGQQIYKNKFNISSHWENATQNHNDNRPTPQNGYYQKDNNNCRQGYEERRTLVHC